VDYLYSQSATKACGFLLSKCVCWACWVRKSAQGCLNILQPHFGGKFAEGQSGHHSHSTLPPPQALTFHLPRWPLSEPQAVLLGFATLRPQLLPPPAASALSIQRRAPSMVRRILPISPDTLGARKRLLGSRSPGSGEQTQTPS